MPWTRRRSVLVGAVAGLVIGTIAAVVIASTGGSAGKPDAILDQPGPVSEPGTFPVAKEVQGTPLPDGTFQRLSGGGTARFADYRGTPLVVNVWAAWCPPCQQEMPDFQRVHEAMGDRVRFVGLDRADSRSAAQAFAAQRGISYDLLFDPDDTFAPQMGVAVMPTTLLVSPDGVVVKTLSGTVSADELTAALQEVFPGVIDGLFAYAFTTGMLATVNPCGFAMLPAYLSYFLGVESADGPDATASSRVSRAVAVSLAVSLGFLSVFTVIGAIVRAGGDVLIEWAKYVTIPIGLALAGLGVAMVLGYHLPFTTPRLDKGGRDRTVPSMYVFGVSYAVASIGCTLPLFIGAALTSFTSRGTVSGVLLVLTYGAGMALVLTALTVTLALARGGLLAGLRRVLPYVDRVAGVFLVLAGLYLVYYWIFNLRFDATGSTTGGGLVSTVEGWSYDTQAWLQDRGGWVLGTLLVGAVAVTAAVSLARRRHTTVSYAVSDPSAFAELLATPGVEEVADVRGRFGFMAFHGGSLEEMTDVIAGAAAEQAGASYYGVHQPKDLQWHLPSTAIDPAVSPALAGFLDHVDVVVTVHGFGREGFWSTLLVGGQNRALAAHVGGYLAAALPAYEIATDLERVPQPLRGLHPRNPVNLPRHGGVQIELPPRVRGQSPIWWDWDGPGLTPHTNALIDALAGAAVSWEPQ